MKLFHFNPNTQGDEYYIISANRTMAHDNLIKFFINKFNIEKNEKLNINSINEFEKWKDVENVILSDGGIDLMDFLNKRTYYGKYITWKRVNPLDPKTFPKEYTLDYHVINEVIESRIA